MKWPEVSLPEVTSNERKNKKKHQMRLAKMTLAALDDFTIHKIKDTHGIFSSDYII